MCDGGILDKSAALSDTHNLAAIHGFIGYGKGHYSGFPEMQKSVIELKAWYFILSEDVYHTPMAHHWEVDEAIDHGHDFGAEYDDLLDGIFKSGSAKQIRQAVNCIVDLFVGRKSTAEILADFPYIP